MFTVLSKLRFFKKTPEVPKPSVPHELEKSYSELESGFLGFWIRQYRLSFLIVLAIIVMGIVSMLAIQKESTPNIKF